MIFCTLFNWAYLPQGIALYHSLERTLGGDFTIYVLCMDDFTAAALKSLALPRLRPLALAQIEDEELRGAKVNRTLAEYCWTCTTPLLLHVQSQFPKGTVVTYVDADIRFFSDPRTILNELGDGSIFIHEHDFAPEHVHLLESAGRFNVGVASFRVDAEGRQCLERWRQQCVDECVMDATRGKCGDQNYLDEWPQRYSGLVISKNPGVGLAPWNIGKHRLQKWRKDVLVDGHALVFYHYHSLRMLRPRFGFRPTLLAYGDYYFGPKTIESLYAPYVRELWAAVARLRLRGYSPTKGFETLPEGYQRMDNRQILFSIFGFTLPMARNGRTINLLYGIDAIRHANPKNITA